MMHDSVPTEPSITGTPSGAVEATGSAERGQAEHASRYHAEADLVRRAAAGDLPAVHSLLQYLDSSYVNLRQIMHAALNDSGDPLIWRCLLSCLALHGWADALELLESGAEELPAHLQVPWHPSLEGAITQAFTDNPCEAGASDARQVKVHALWQVLKQGGDMAPRLTPTPQRKHIRYTAAFLLGLLGEADVIPLLETIIDDPEPPSMEDLERKVHAVQSLAALHDARCGPPLLKALAHPGSGSFSGYKKLHQEASRALSELGALAGPTWQVALSHPDNHVRWHAARGLGEIGDPQGITILVEGLHDESPAVRWTTAQVLAQLDHTALRSQALQAILQLLIRHPLNEPFRQAVYHALHGMSSPKTQQFVQPLLQALHNPASSVEAPAVAQQLLVAARSNEAPGR